MAPRRPPAGSQSSFEPELIPPRRALRLRAVPQTIGCTHFRFLAGLEPIGVVLLAPAILVLAVAIIIALLGYFVVWLIVFWSMVAEIVAADMIRCILARARPPMGALGHGAASAGQ
jgi:hypothetical protein